MLSKYREFAATLRSFRWLNLFGYFALVFVFFCCSDWRVFSERGISPGLRAGFGSFTEWLLYGIIIVPLVCLAWWLLNKIDVRGAGFRIGNSIRRTRGIRQYD